MVLDWLDSEKASCSPAVDCLGSATRTRSINDYRLHDIIICWTADCAVETGNDEGMGVWRTNYSRTADCNLSIASNQFLTALSL